MLGFCTKGLVVWYYCCKYTEDTGDTKGSFIRNSDQLPIYHMKILQGNYNAKVERKNILKST